MRAEFDEKVRNRDQLQVEEVDLLELTMSMKNDLSHIDSGAGRVSGDV
ncbi:hypothetical protein [Brevibacterium aurantiacum]|nr:hypothetical protein [Brevibacterium aurantiacum]